MRLLIKPMNLDSWESKQGNITFEAESHEEASREQ